MQNRLAIGPLKKLIVFRKLRLKNFFHKKLSFEPNINPHHCDMGPMLWNWGKAYSKILDTPVSRGIKKFVFLPIDRASVALFFYAIWSVFNYYLEGEGVGEGEGEGVTKLQWYPFALP
jgi:hypothetical protein